MRPGDPLLGAALDAGEREYTVRARLGGRDITDEVDAWSIDRSYESGLPDQVAATAGTAAAQAKLSLSGEGTQTAAQRYSPWAPRQTADVTRPGQSLVLDWGVGGQALQSMRGRIRQVTASSAEGTADVVALDGAELLRGPAWLPPSAPGAPGVTVPGVIDHILRQAGIYESPPERPDSILFVPFNRSAVASRGMLLSWSSLGGYDSDLSPWTAGLLPATATEWTATYVPQRRPITQFTTLVVDWWVLADEAGQVGPSQTELVFRSGESGSSTRVTVRFDPQTWQLRVGVGGTTWTTSIPATHRAPGRVKVTAQITLQSLSDPTQVRAWATTPAGTYSTPTRDGASPVFGWLHTITASSRWPMECLGVATVSGGSVPITAEWTKTAEILPGVSGDTYRMDAAPDVSGTWWSVLKQIADAHHLYLGFDEDGIFRVHARDYVTPDTAPPPDLTVTAARELAQVQVSEEIDGVANVISAEVTEFDTTPPLEDWWRGAVETIPAGGQLHFVVPETERAWATCCPMPYITSGDGTADVSRVKFLTGAGQIAPVEVELFHEPGQTSITYYNRGASSAYTRTGDAGSQGSLVLARRPVSSSSSPPVRLINPASVNRFGQQALDVGSSPWVQTRAQALGVITHLMAWTREPIPLTGDIDVLPDPRVQLGDTVRIVDTTGSMVDGVFRVLGISVSGRGPEVSMRLTVRPMYRPAAPADVGLTVEPIADPDVAPVYPG